MSFDKEIRNMLQTVISSWKLNEDIWYPSVYFTRTARSFLLIN